MNSFENNPGANPSEDSPPILRIFRTDSRAVRIPARAVRAALLPSSSPPDLPMKILLTLTLRMQTLPT